MTDLETRLTGALSERVDQLTSSPDAWEQNLIRLAQARRSEAQPRFRAPLMIAAAVILLAVSILTVQRIDRPAPAVTPPPVVNADGVGCGFNKVPDQKGKYVTSMELPYALDNRLLVMVIDPLDYGTCFFDSVGWHHAQAVESNAGDPLRLMRVSRSGGQTWLWGLGGGNMDHVRFTDTNGHVTNSLYIGGFVVPIVGSGTAQAIAADGRVLATAAVDATKVSATPAGPILRKPWYGNRFEEGGMSLACPAGAPDARAEQPVSGGQPIAFALLTAGADGEPVICADGGTSPEAAVLTELTGTPTLAIHQFTSPRLWGVVSDRVSRLEITLTKGGPTTTFVADPAQAVDGSVAMAHLGPYLTYAMIEPADVDTPSIQFQAFDASGKLIPQPTSG